MPGERHPRRMSSNDRATLPRAFEQLKAKTEKLCSGMFQSTLTAMQGDKFLVPLTIYDDTGKTGTVQMSPSLNQL